MILEIDGDDRDPPCALLSQVELVRVLVGLIEGSEVQIGWRDYSGLKVHTLFGVLLRAEDDVLG